MGTVIVFWLFLVLTNGSGIEAKASSTEAECMAEQEQAAKDGSTLHVSPCVRIDLAPRERDK